MALTLKEEKRLELEKSFKEANRMAADDVIVENTLGDYYEFMSQVRGNYYFTQERVIFESSWGIEKVNVKYSDIREIRKSFVGPFLPFGVTITAVNQGNNNDKTKKYKLSLMKRKYWMELLSNKSGIVL